MAYNVKEIFYSLQGEGAQTGRPAVFCRFTGCNLWSGREADRATAVCRFCDTDFVGTDGPGGGRFATAENLAQAIAAAWPGDTPGARPMVVCTGGEPLLQLDPPLIDALHGRGFFIAVETNGTQPVPDGVDWLCVSPKSGSRLIVGAGDEIKVPFPQPGLDLDALLALDFAHRYLLPIDGPERAANTQAALRHCLTHPQWKLTLQTHKILSIP